MKEGSQSSDTAPRISLRERLILIFVLVVVILSSIGFVAVNAYRKANANALQVRAEAEERLEIAEKAEINFEREISAWKNVLLHGYEHERYYDYLSQFYENERETFRTLNLLVDKLESEKELRELAYRLNEEHRSKSIALRQALRTYNESESDPYRVANEYVEASAKDILKTLVQTAKSVRDRQFEQIQSDLQKQEQTLFGITVTVLFLFAFLILWVVDREVGQPAEKAIRLEAEIRAKQADLIQAKEKAEAANRAKEEFLAVMSHELRTPLNPIIGFARLLINKEKNSEKDRMLKCIEDSGTHMLKLVEDILSFSKIGKGKHDVSDEEINLFELCENIIRSFEAHAKSKRNKLHFEPRLQRSDYLPVSTDQAIVADPRILKQILFNLLSNACKFTENGSISLRFGFKDSTQSKDLYRIEIKDTGIGIPENDQGRIFEPFTQADSSLARNHEGMGLGLSLCASLVETIGGKIGLESKTGIGSVFWVEIPCETLAQYRPQTTPKAFPQIIQNGVSENLLVAEDNPDNQLLISTMLKRLGYQSVTLVENGMHACNEFKTRRFDLILMDVNMPVVGGLDATRQIRSQETGDEPTPIIAMTAYASDRDRELCEIAGMNDFLSKPIDIENLSSCLGHWLKRA